MTNAQNDMKLTLTLVTVRYKIVQNEGGIMGKLSERDFCDELVVSGEPTWHSYYYLSPYEIVLDEIRLMVSRTGVERQIPGVFRVSRDCSPYCEIFCIQSGKGTLTYAGREWEMKENQIVILPSGEGHSYSSNPQFPLAKTWVEFYGGDSERISKHIVSKFGPLIDSQTYNTVCDRLSALQQRLMIDERYIPSVEIYEILITLLQSSNNDALVGGAKEALKKVEAYIDAHLIDTIRNEQLASICNVSVQYLTKMFKKRYGQTPQAYIMNRRLFKSKYLLIKTSLPIEQIAETLGFWNDGHFISRFKEKEGITPAKYRKQYRIR